MEGLPLRTKHSIRMGSWRVKLADWLLEGLYTEVKENAHRLWVENSELKYNLAEEKNKTKDLKKKNKKLAERVYGTDSGKKKKNPKSSQKEARNRRGK